MPKYYHKKIYHKKSRHKRVYPLIAKIFNMSPFFRYFLSIIAFLGGIAFIVMSIFAGGLGGSIWFWVYVIIGIALIAVSLAIRPR